MNNLIAIYPILYHSTQYKVGQILPANDQKMVQAWIKAGTAEWRDDSEKKEKPVQAKPVTAEPGLAGESGNGESADNLVGKVPETPARTRPKAKK